MTVTRNFVLFNTDLFVFRQDEKDIDQWFVGGDCAGWFYARLLPCDHMKPHCDPVMEDWGWTFAVMAKDVKVWINVWAYFEIENCWLLGIEARKRLLGGTTSEKLLSAKITVGDAIEDIMSRDSRILKRRWFAENPFDLGIREI